MGEEQGGRFWPAEENLGRKFDLNFGLPLGTISVCVCVFFFFR